MRKRFAKKKLWKTILFLFGVSLFLWNCEQSENIINYEELIVEKKIEYSLKKIAYNGLLNDSDFKSSYKTIYNRFSNKKEKQSYYSKGKTKLNNDLVILTDEIKRIDTPNGVITWTFETESTVFENSDFENFVVKKHNNEFYYYLFTYTYDNQDTEQIFESIKSYRVREEYLSLDNISFSAGEGTAIDWVFDDIGGGGEGTHPDCAKIVTEITPCDRGGYHEAKYHCQHPAPGHGMADTPPCDQVCSGTNIIAVADYSECEGTYNPPSGPSNDPADDGGNTGGTTGGGTPTDSTDETNNNSEDTVTSPINSDGTSMQLEASSINTINNLMMNPLTSDPIEFYLIAKYLFDTTLDISVFQIASSSSSIGEYTVTPHYDSNGVLVFYAAARQNGKNLGIEYIIKANALTDFQNNINLYTFAANMFYVGGIPSQGQIAMAAGDYWSGLGSMWNDAIHSPEWWAYTITSFGHAIANLPVNSVVSSTQTVPSWRVSLNKMTSNSFKGKVVTNPQGVKVTIDIPDNYVASIANNGKGLNFRPLGSSTDANLIRIMQPTSQNLNGYAVFYNSYGQPFNPLNGQTLSQTNWHFGF